MGKKWKSIRGNLPSEPVNVIREDPRDPATLYLGTDLGVYITRDRGRHWDFLGSGLPTTPVHDLMVQPQSLDLVLASHGRGIFVLDIGEIAPDLQNTD